MQGTLRKKPEPTGGAMPGASAQSVEEAIEVAVPVHTAYNQWTQFKTFPRFMRWVRASNSSARTSPGGRSAPAGRPGRTWRRSSSSIPTS
ncbi:SRPBCC family protein [Streptomyces thermocarboxydus]